ncbi:MAG: permease [Patescibacteria group bacterium]|jgi:hypothetical protein
MDKTWQDIIEYFIYDTLKIFVLLIVIIFIVSIIRTFFSPAKARDILAKRHSFFGYISAALLGVVTPFCSCSAVPLFLGFVEAGVPLGITFTFLVASPMVNEVALVLMLGMFGWKIAVVYIVSGLIIAIVSGFIIGKLNVENLIDKSIYDNKKELQLKNKNWKERLTYAKNYTFKIFKKVWLFIIIGVALGAFIHGYVPEDFLAQYAGADKWYAVPLVVLIGIPLYSNAAGMIPLVSALMEKGVAVGTALAFMMAVTALSLPEFMILKRIMKTKLILIFAAVVGIGIIFTGYLFNYFFK